MTSHVTIFAFLALSLNLVSATPSGEIVPLIVGGVNATAGEFPWMVDIRRPSHYCEASIVNQDWVVTAAHCTQGAVSGYTVVAGDHDINNPNEGSEQTRTIEKIVNHPSYSPGTFENDISLMKVSTPFQLNDRVQPVALPASHFTPTIDTTAVGWGRTSEGGQSSPHLLKVDVPYVDDATCNQAYSKDQGLHDLCWCCWGGRKRRLPRGFRWPTDVQRWENQLPLWDCQLGNWMC